MTIESAIGMSASQLEAMSDADLEKHFGQYLIVTRPENTVSHQQKEARVLQANPQFDLARKLAASVGINIPVIIPSRKRK